ncbi:hypothetical protein [Krasilnikovia sp. MM14-A1259]|uniref:hypothetical protein n=1 Tax=Krasilnikovia sp. MM14-A1259 TaxID=3373539 RepID=UPI0037FB95E0
MKALLNSLTDAELGLVRETEREQIVAADEDTLVDLHLRIRRARDKYVGLYRRQASARVSEYGGRGKARPKNTRNAEKAEVFEDALSRVSRQLAVAARRSAQQLRSERLAAAREARNMAPPTVAQRRGATGPKAAKRAAPAKRASPGAGQAARKRQAASAAAGARRQARRDRPASA